jgi:methylmalonyl-CoA mutase
MGQKEKLFEQFPPETTREWMDKITTDLKGADFNKKLVWKTNEGFEVNPFYRMEDIQDLMYSNVLPGEFPYIRGTKVNDNSWLVRQNIEVSNYSKANRKALNILMKGVDSIGFVIADPETITEINFNMLLERLFLEGIELNFFSNGKAKEIVDLLINYIKKSSFSLAKVSGAIEADPLSRLMLNGTLCIPPGDGFDYLASLVNAAEPLSLFRVVNLNASNISNAGADIVQELAFAISMGCEYMMQLTQRGIKSELAASKIGFTFGTGSNYFPEIAKLRAARLLWSVVLNGFKPADPENIKMNIHCVTSEWNKTIYDPYVNLLRTQTEAMSAILGGADSLTVEPFDTVFRQPDEFSERIARNQQLILKEEAYFDKVADPAAGSYYIENLTSLIAENAWKLFLEIEEKGGFLACLKSGLIQSKLSESAKKRQNDVATRKISLLGTNQYPNTLEKISDTIDPVRVFKTKAVGDDLLIDPITIFRGSQQFDKIRIAVDKAPKRPLVFLLQIGNLVMRKARAQFSANFFGSGGYEIIDNKSFETSGDAAESAIESGADIVVICSSDEEYQKFAPELYLQLKEKAIIVVAGNPACVDELKAKGIENFIHLRSNVVSILTDFNEKLGIEP